MGRGRQKAKQTKIARKLKYLTTDTDYDELAKELSDQDSVEGAAAEQVDPFADIDKKFQHDHELDEYAQWAAEAAAKAEQQEQATAAVRKPIPIPVPSALKTAAKPATGPSPLAAVAKATVTKGEAVAKPDRSPASGKAAKAPANAALKATRPAAKARPETTEE